jgi:phosphoribosylformylglycinamidine cyclo-ligase
MKRTTYAMTGAGVDAKADAIKQLTSQLKHRRRRFRNVVEGHYSSLIDFGDVYLTLCTDGVGSKILVAEALGKWDTVGIDCVAMNVNDTICVGAEPISFVDYIACDVPDGRILKAIGKGLNEGVRQADVEIVGGEIALLPAIVNGFDIVGTCLGYVDKKNIVTGAKITIGDSIIAISSSGIHSNGLTLARRVVKDRGIELTDEVRFEGERFVIGEELLIPTVIYVKEALALCKEFDVKGLAHITGGGLRNIKRLNPNVMFRIKHLPEPPRIFRLIAKWGNVETKEMYQTFNMGMGMVVVVPKNECDEVLQRIEKRRAGWKIGEVVKGSGVEVPGLKLRFTRY